jgi:hypothetical protein
MRKRGKYNKIIDKALIVNEYLFFTKKWKNEDFPRKIEKVLEFYEYYFLFSAENRLFFT